MKELAISIALLGVIAFSQAQVSNAKTASVGINGNCGMCKRTIEKAGSAKGLAVVSWDADTQSASVTYDSAATTLDAVLKRVAYAGYDNDGYLAPAEAYAALHACCRYERRPQAAAVTAAHPVATESMAHHQGQARPIDRVLDAYFALKDALIAGEAGSVPPLATALSTQLEGLATPDAKKAASVSAEVAGVTSIDGQRAVFARLSENLYGLAKANTPTVTVYYQHCPMYSDGKKKGANWLSAGKAIRNPYYGDRMLTCGSVAETLGGGSRTRTHQHE